MKSDRRVNVAGRGRMLTTTEAQHGVAAHVRNIGGGLVPISAPSICSPLWRSSSAPGANYSFGRIHAGGVRTPEMNK
jgi:hypothetical protein